MLLVPWKDMPYTLNLIQSCIFLVLCWGGQQGAMAPEKKFPLIFGF